MAKAKPTTPKIQFAPDAWERFETLVKSAAKMGHQPHKATRPQPKVAVKTAKRIKKRQREG